MNRAERRNQKSPKSSARKSGLTFLTVAGVVGGSLGLATPVQADAVANSCPTLLAGLQELEINGGTLTADFSDTCDFSEGFIFQQPTTITGPTDGSLTLRFTGDRGSTAAPIDYVGDGFTAKSTLTISNLNFTRPADSRYGFDYFVFVEDQPVVVSNSKFSNAELSAAIYAEGNLTVSNSTFENLHSFEGGSAISLVGAADAQITDSTFSNNDSYGQSSGGAIQSFYALSISNSTFESNFAANYGGAVAAYGGAEITNSTFVGNGAFHAGAVQLSEGGLISNSTFWNNGTIQAFSIGAEGVGETYLFGNILANDTPNTLQLVDPLQTTTDLGANLYTDDSFDDTTTGDGESKLVTLDELKLGSLALNQMAPTNSGITKTVPIGAGSIAKDYYTAIPALGRKACLSSCGLAATDQRGVARPFGAGYDVGAFEIGETPDPGPSEEPEVLVPSEEPEVLVPSEEPEVTDPTPSSSPDSTPSETLADTGSPSNTGFLGLAGLGLAAILGGSAGILRRRKKV